MQTTNQDPDILVLSALNPGSALEKSDFDGRIR